MSADFSDRTVNTVFFGGGTPSVLPARLLGKVIDTIITKYNVANNAEISIETNPGTLNAKNLSEMNSMYFNRLSKIGRAHV